MNSASEKKLPVGNYPDWLNIRPFKRPDYASTLSLINEHNLNTVCISGNCPNRYECFSCGTATFMVLGDVCTRNCRYCNIKRGQPKAVDVSEPVRIGEAVKKLKLKYAVLTQVTRDDLPDGGAGHLAETIKAIRALSPDSKIEILISDLGGNFLSLKKVLSARPDVLNHNIETVSRLFPILRPQGNYLRSLVIIKKVKNISESISSKSGLMLGLGETRDEIINTMKDLRRVGCDIITLGQYLQPTPDHAELKKYYTPEEFGELKTVAEKLGFKKVFSGPMVRSSYRAGEI